MSMVTSCAVDDIVGPGSGINQYLKYDCSSRVGNLTRLPERVVGTGGTGDEREVAAGGEGGTTDDLSAGVGVMTAEPS